MGNHWGLGFPVGCSAWSRTPTVVLEHQPTSTYPERICRRCNRGVDDEAHWLLKCRALLHIRRKYTTLLRNRRSVDKLMTECHV
jgi:hypothetical protein